MSTYGIWHFQQGVLWAIDLTAYEPPQVEPRISARFETVGAASIPMLAKAMGDDSLQLVRSRLRGNRRCFAAWVGNDIASYCWISQGMECVGEIERTFRFAPDEVYVWDCATLPEYRRQGLYTALLDFISRQLIAEGIHTVWIGTNADNQASLRAFAKVGYQLIISVTYSRLGKLCLLLTRADPDAPHHLVPAARRVFTTTAEHNWGPLIVGWHAPELRGC